MFLNKKDIIDPVIGLSGDGWASNVSLIRLLKGDGDLPSMQIGAALWVS